MCSIIINGENEESYFRSCSCWIENEDCRIEGWGFSRGLVVLLSLFFIAIFLGILRERLG